MTYLLFFFFLFYSDDDDDDNNDDDDDVVMTTYFTSIIHRFSPKRYREKCRSTERLFYPRLLETLSFVLCLGDLNLSLDYISPLVI